MGYITTILIANTDLPAIASDRGFGQSLSGLIQGNSRIRGNPRRGVGVDRAAVTRPLSQRLRGAEQGYEIQAAHPVHASMTGVAVVRAGRLHDLTAGPESELSDAVQALCDAMAAHGIFMSAPSGIDPADVTTGQEVVDEISWMSGWTDAALEKASTVLTVNHDAVDMLGADERLGLRVSEAIRDWQRHMQMVSSHANQPYLRRFLGSPPRSVASGNHANPVIIAGTVPAGRIAPVICQGGSAFILHPYLTALERVVTPAHQGLFARRRAAGVEAIITALKDHGIDARREDPHASPSANGPQF